MLKMHYGGCKTSCTQFGGGGRPRDKELKRLHLAGVTVHQVRGLVLHLNALRVWVFTLQMVVSAEDGVWFNTTPARSTATLKMWRTALTQGASPTSRTNRTALQQVTLPFRLTRDWTESRGWVYFIHGRATLDNYVGCTSRGGGKNRGRAPRGQQPYHRWVEHVQGATKCRFFNPTKGLPMYRRMRLLNWGVADCVWIPVWGLADTTNDPSRTGTNARSSPPGSISRCVRAAETLLQVLTRPGWCVPFVAERSVIRRRTTGYGLTHTRPQSLTQPETGGRQVERDPSELSGWLRDSVTGEQWQAGRQWTHQFQVGRLRMDETALSLVEHTTLITRLVLHGGRAGTAYPVLRRLSGSQVVELLRFAYACNPRWEDQVWRHIQLATRGRHTRVRIRRIRLLDRVTHECRARDVLQPIAQLVVRQDPRLLVRFRAYHGKSVGQSLINEGMWQRRFAAGGCPSCTCATLTALVHPRTEKLCTVSTAQGDHLWCDWQSLFAGDTRSDAGISALSVTRTALVAQGFDPRGPLPLHAKTTLSESRASLVKLVAQELGRLLHEFPAASTLAQRVSSADWRTALWFLAEQWCGASVGHAEEPLDQPPILSRQWLMRTWKWRSQLAVSTMEKRPANMRLSCPVLFWVETLSEIEVYFTRLCSVSVRQAQVLLVDWHNRVSDLCQRTCGHTVDVEAGEPLTCRCLPKGKAPGVKRRLVLSYVGAPPAEIAGIASRAVEGVLQIGCKHLGWSDEAVSSTEEVIRVFRDLQEVVSGTEHWLYVVKYDFVNFYMNVCRSEAYRALDFWLHVIRTAFPSRRFVLVRRRNWRAIHRDLREQVTSLSPDVQLARTPGDPQEWWSIRLDSLGDWLREDASSLLQFAGALWSQDKGLTIGSPWGGVACHAWASYQEYRMRFIRSWSLRSAECEERATLRTRRGHTMGSLGAMRWVDDRWRVLRVCSPAVAHKCIVTDVCGYAGVYVG